LHFDLKKQLLLLKAELQVKHLEIKELWDVDTLDEDAVLSKSDEVFETEKQIHQATTRHHLEAAKLLTKEQRAKLMKSRHSKQNRHGKKGRGFRTMRRDGDDGDRKRMRHQSTDHHRMSREDIIEKFDEDGDGKLSREEGQNAAKWRENLRSRPVPRD